MMSKEEERELIIAWRERGDQKAFMRLVEEQRRLMISQSRKHVNARVGYDDLLQQGAIGLMRALEPDKFDLERKYRFVTYANWFTRDEIAVAGRKNSNAVTVPQSHMTGKGREIWEAWVKDAAACAEGGMDGSEAAIRKRVAAAMSVTEERVAAVVDAWQSGSYSMDAPLNGEDGDREQALPTALINSDTTEASLIRSQAEEQSHTLIAPLMSVLDEREQDIIRRRRFENETLEEVSKVHSISRERVRQLEKRAFEKMQAAGTQYREMGRDCIHALA